ncbi:MAG: AarF/UbiB family protein [Anaerostipes sp.]|nr:AarF/UbiB family protein [Anaerostipes sp.]
MSKQSVEYRGRLREITAVLHKYEITKGLTPKKLRLILEELGPTFIKLGQIMSMHSDILSKEYCDELMQLQAGVLPIDFKEIINVIEDSYGYSWKQIFREIEERPLGSASIAQVHRAKLKNGEDVVVKVQKKDIGRLVARDIALLRKAAKLLPPVGIKEVVDIDMVLDELWAVTKEEMNFLMEAANMLEFAAKNKEVEFVGVPKLYQEYTTVNVLVMEYIHGYGMDQKEELLDAGYDLEEIGTKLVDNYMKQVIEDGFFHADPHGGNVKIRDGKIVWIDMGMMGRLSRKEQSLLKDAVKGIAFQDIDMIEEAVLKLGDFKEPPNQGTLYEGIQELLLKYGDADMGSINVAEITMSLMDVMKKNKIIVPHGLTMLARGLTHVEGIMTDLCPDTNMISIASRRILNSSFENMDWKKELKKGGQNLYRTLHKASEIPILISDVLHGYMRGQHKFNMELRTSKELESLMRRLIRNIVMGLWVMALLISSSIICTTDMKPKVAGIPLLGLFGYLIAFFIVMYVFLRHMWSEYKH